jgi:hypothetical protein
MIKIQRRTSMVCTLAALGALGVFLGPDGWLGFAFGPVGAVVLYALLWLLIANLAKHSDAIFPPDSSLAERLSWVSLVFVTLIFFHYLNFLQALAGLGAEADQISNPASRGFGINLGMLIFVWISVAGILRAQNRDSPELDERDLRIQNAAGRLANGLMASLMIGFVVLLALLPEHSGRWMRPLIVGNALVGLLIVRTLAENVHLVMRYRRERA